MAVNSSAIEERFLKAITRLSAVSMCMNARVVGRHAIITTTATDMSRYISERRDNYDYHYKTRKHKEATVFQMPALQVRIFLRQDGHVREALHNRACDVRRRMSLVW